MSTAATTKMTAEEFAAWVEQPEQARRWFELVRGEVIELPPPSKKHGIVCVNIAWVLQNYTRQQRKGYVTSNDSGVILEHEPDTVRGPDVAYYGDATTFAEVHPKYGEAPPRLAVEVLSPNDRATVVQQKLVDYLTNGVELVWLVDPDKRSVTIYRPDKPLSTLSAEQEITGDPVLPGFRWPIADFFRLLGESNLQH